MRSSSSRSSSCSTLDIVRGSAPIRCRPKRETVGVKAAYELIEADMRAIWGDMALAMLRKRVRDVRAALTSLTEADVEKMDDLLRGGSLPSMVGEGGAAAQAKRSQARVAKGS